MKMATFTQLQYKRIILVLLQGTRFYHDKNYAVREIVQHIREIGRKTSREN